ncbi:MAG: hypothetical protein H7066_19755 [Cytophagaceae bacterium]|nr:hypothetical protein [Gemmatimonadaceae bacterium]
MANAPLRRGFGYYIKRALVEKWNLGLLAAAVGFSVLSPMPDALLPIVVGLEGLFLLGMAGNSRFRQAMDAEDAKGNRAASDVSSAQAYVQLVERLDQKDRSRFRQLVMHCQQMQRLASGVQGGSGPADAMRSSALDRLLFFYLRLLVTRESLTTFLAQSDIEDLRARRARVAEQLSAAEASREERLRASLADTLSDLDTRIANVEKSLKDAKYLEIELERIEGKAQALAEAAITRQDPTELAAQVTAFTDTLKLSEDVEARMVSLQGLELASTDAPAILSSNMLRTDA